MIKPLRLVVLTPAATLLDVAGIAWIQVQLADGAGLGIFPGHAPLLAETVSAPLRYADGEGQEHRLALDAGILHITRESVQLYTGGLLAELASPPAPEDGEAPARFERLALALLTALHAAPETVDA